MIRLGLAWLLFSSLLGALGSFMDRSGFEGWVRETAVAMAIIAAVVLLIWLVVSGLATTLVTEQ